MGGAWCGKRPGVGMEGSVYSQLRTTCKTAGVGNSLTNHLDLNDSHVKCSSLQFVVNTNHMKVASDSIGPCDCHVT